MFTWLLAHCANSTTLRSQSVSMLRLPASLLCYSESLDHTTWTFLNRLLTFISTCKQVSLWRIHSFHAPWTHPNCSDIPLPLLQWLWQSLQEPRLPLFECYYTPLTLLIASSTQDPCSPPSIVTVQVLFACVVNKALLFKCLRLNLLLGRNSRSGLTPQ